MDYLEILPEELIVNICEYLQSDIKLLKITYFNNKYIILIIDRLLNNVKNGDSNPNIWFKKVYINQKILQFSMNMIRYAGSNITVNIKDLDIPDKNSIKLSLLKYENHIGYLHKNDIIFNDLSHQLLISKVLNNYMMYSSIQNPSVNTSHKIVYIEKKDNIKSWKKFYMELPPKYQNLLLLTQGYN